MNPRTYYRLAALCATFGVGLSVGNVTSPSGPSFFPQFLAGVLTVGAWTVAYITKTTP